MGYIICKVTKGIITLALLIMLIGLVSTGNLCAQIKQQDVDFEFIDTVTIRSGDMLWKLAAKYYNDPLKWSIIKELNKIPNEKAMPVGITIFIPSKTAKRVVAGTGEKMQQKKFSPNTLLSAESLKINDIVATQSIIGIGDTTTMETLIDYTGDETVLMYSWSADAGSIRGSGRRIVYKAPDSPGTYQIRVKATDGATSSEKSIEVKVEQQTSDSSLVIDRDKHWPAVAPKDKLSYNVTVNRLTGRKVLLHYDVTQDKDDFDTFLTIEIDQKNVLQEMAIGGEQPSTGIRTVRYLDISNIITGPGQYMITLYLRPGDRIGNGWLMNEVRFVGVEGSTTPQP